MTIFRDLTLAIVAGAFAGLVIANIVLWSLP